MSGLELVVFAIATCATPGPVNVMATMSGARSGLRRNLPFVLGATIGLSLVIIVSGFGISQILRTNQLLANSVTLIGSAYILYLAYLMARDSIQLDSRDGSNQTTTFNQGAILQILNPKAWLVSMSGIALYLGAQEQSTLVVYVVIFCLTCFASVFSWVCLGSLIATRLKSSWLTGFTRLMALLLAVLVLYNLLTTVFS